MKHTENKQMSLAAKFYLSLVFPLICISAIVAFITNQGLVENASELTHALKIQAEAKEILPLLLIQDDASKAMLINPDQLDEYSEIKIDAYDKHKILLDDILKSSGNDELNSIVKKLNKIDESILRPIDTAILETLFTDVDDARKMYFEKYTPERKKYEDLIRRLAEVGSQRADEATVQMNDKNQRSILLILIALFLGISVVIVVINILSKKIEKSRKNMDSLLGSLNEGLFFFDKEGTIAQERSQALQRIFEDSASYNDIFTFFETLSGSKKESIEAVLGFLWQDPNDDFFSEFESTVTMLPKRVCLKADGKKNKEIKLEYNPIYDNDENLEKVVVIVSDITAELIAERQAVQQAERVLKISKAAMNTDSFQDFVQEINGITQRIHSEISSEFQNIDIKTLKRDLHTMKGSIGSYEFVSVADQVHKLEDLMESDFSSDNLEVLRNSWQEIYKNWSFEYKDVKNVLKLKDDDNRISVDRTKVERLIEAGRQYDSKLQSLCYALYKDSLEHLFSNYISLVEKQNRKLEGKSVVLSFAKDSEEITKADAQQVQAALVHIIRNCMDHGIEPEDDRENRGKDAIGNIVMKATNLSGKISLTIEDDGGGINGDRLVEKAVSNGILDEESAKSLSAEDKINLIFMPNLSSKDQVTDISGRGVGMDAVKAHMESIGGSITVTSTLGQGSQFELIFNETEYVGKSVEASEITTTKIYVVEDDEDSAETISEMLASYGYKVSTFISPLDAIKSFDHDKPNLIVTDFIMPEMNGDQLREVIQQKDDQVPVAVCSGYIDTDVGSQVAGKFDGVIRKPIDWDELVRLVDTLTSPQQS